jgi:hypothetical protein
MAIDYKKAHQRIVAAYLKGLTQTYGLRRTEKEIREVERPGGTYWDPKEAWTDPNNVPRVGRFKRKPPVTHRVEVEVPRGVVPEEVLEYAGAMAEVFLEVLRIVEEAQDGDGS